jgi:hypothetical protein
MVATVEERFWAKVDRRGADECWPWTGAVNGDGYGFMFKSNKPRKWYRSNRLAFELLIGPLPDGLQALHTCDNPPCCNPRHLYAGTPADNARDRETRGRAGNAKRRGPGNGRAKLSPAQVVEIRRRYVEGEKQIALATEFGVKQPQISRIVRGLQYVGE